MLQQPDVVERWVRVLLVCIASSSLGVVVASAAYLTGWVFPTFSSLPCSLTVVCGFLFAVLCSLFALVYSKRVEKNLDEKVLLSQRAERVGLQLIKMGLSLGSISILPLSYLLIRPLLNSSLFLTQFFIFYFLRVMFPFDAYISLIIFIMCFSSACFLLAAGLILYRKGRKSRVLTG